MKKSERLAALLMVLVFMFTLAMSSAVIAATDNGKGNIKDTGKSDSTKAGEKDNGNGKNELKKTESGNSTVEAEDKTDEEAEEEKSVKEKDKVMAQKKELKKQLIQARKSGDEAGEAELLTQLAAYKEQLKQMVRAAYTEEELQQLEQAAKAIEAEDPELEVLSVEKIIAKGKTLKLDLPPVIKEGKVLVPVRAFSQAYGAEVQYDAETKTITILKDGMKIEFVVGSSIVYVDGAATDIELPVKNINGRTVMPVGFLAEKLGLKAEVDDEDGTVEVEDSQETGE